MSGIVQTQEVVRLYEYDYDKPPLDNDFLQHYGVKGMRWGVRKDKKKIFGSKRRKRKEKTYKTNEEAIAAKDLKYIQKNKDKFSTKELNQVMNRIEAETKLDKMAKQSSSEARKKVKKIISNKYVKIAGVVVLAAGAAALYRHNYDIWKANPKLLTDKSMKKGGQIFRDFGAALKYGGRGAFNDAAGKYIKLFKGMVSHM